MSAATRDSWYHVGWQRWTPCGRPFPGRGPATCDMPWRIVLVWSPTSARGGICGTVPCGAHSAVFSPADGTPTGQPPTRSAFRAGQRPEQGTSRRALLTFSGVLTSSLPSPVHNTQGCAETPSSLWGVSRPEQALGPQDSQNCFSPTQSVTGARHSPAGLSSSQVSTATFLSSGFRTWAAAVSAPGGPGSLAQVM